MFKNFLTVVLVALVLGVYTNVNARTIPYQITKVATGYKVMLPTQIVSDFANLPQREALVMSLVDPQYGVSRIQGYGEMLDKSTILMVSTENFTFLPDLNRTYVVFELKNTVAGGGSCAGCTLTNRNLKSVSPNICWCFSKISSGLGSNSQCATTASGIRFPTPAESAAHLKQRINEPVSISAQAYGECYPSSGPGGEDCSLFSAICDAAGGGSASLPGGGVSCDTRQ